MLLQLYSVFIIHYILRTERAEGVCLGTLLSRDNFIALVFNVWIFKSSVQSMYVCFETKNIEEMKEYVFGEY